MFVKIRWILILCILKTVGENLSYNNLGEKNTVLFGAILDSYKIDIRKAFHS